MAVVISIVSFYVYEGFEEHINHHLAYIIIHMLLSFLPEKPTKVVFHP